MPKCCKVIAFYFGARRVFNNNPTTPAAVLELLQQSIECERTIDPGVSMDTILVNNAGGYHEGNLFVDGLEGQPTKRGRFIVVNRGNVGGGFGAFNEAWQLYKQEYDYWLFNEDDIILTVDGYYKKCVAFLKKNPQIGYAVLSMIGHAFGYKHCGGAFGVSSRELLQRVEDLNGGSLPSPGSLDYGSLEQGEVRFTGLFQTLGLDIANIPGYSPYPSNHHLHHTSLPHMAGRPLDPNEKFVYRVGLDATIDTP